MVARGTPDGVMVGALMPGDLLPGERSGRANAACERAIRARIAELYPQHQVVAITPLRPDAEQRGDATTKAAGYGAPQRIDLVDRDGEQQSLVWRIASANEFGHDRPSDRAANQLLAYSDFAAIPDHVRALELGTVGSRGELQPLPWPLGEFYLITSYAPGAIYAGDLRRIAATGVVTPSDRGRAERLAHYLAHLHVPIACDPADRRTRYRRAIRDLIGSGEGIFGIVDGYPAGVPGASRTRLAALERDCLAWRHRLADNSERLVRVHGDFHPFNLVFEGERLTLLDASRGTCGDAADDITALTINYLLFAVGAPDPSAAWQGLGELWQRVWSSYRAARADRELLAVVPPFLAWRALVVCNPRFYPDLAVDARDRLLGLAERAVASGYFEPASAGELFG